MIFRGQVLAKAQQSQISNNLFLTRTSGQLVPDFKQKSNLCSNCFAFQCTPIIFKLLFFWKFSLSKLDVLLQLAIIVWIYSIQYYVKLLLDVESYTIGQITTQGLLIYIFLVFFDKFSGYNRENKLKSLENIYKFFKIQSLYENVAQKLSAHWDFRINKSLIKQKHTINKN